MINAHLEEEEPLADEETMQSPQMEAQNLNDSMKAEPVIERVRNSKPTIQGLNDEEIEYGEELKFKIG